MEECRSTGILHISESNKEDANGGPNFQSLVTKQCRNIKFSRTVFQLLFQTLS